MANTVRYPLAEAMTAKEFNFFGRIRCGQPLDRWNAKLVRDQHSGSRYNNQYLRLLEKAKYRSSANMVVKNFMAGNVDDVLVDRRVHGWID
jgi:hypothetical protein